MIETNVAPVGDERMREILEAMLANDEDITARAVVRQHPAIKAASSITRSESRRRLLVEYQKRQSEYRRWRGRVAKRSGTDTATSLADKDIRIAELETTVQLLTASHIAMLRAVGELGGFSRWAKFYESYREAREKIVKLGAVPAEAEDAIRPARSIAAAGQSTRKKRS